MSASGTPINVRQEIIDVAIRRDSSHCAVQMAIQEKLPHASAVMVDIQTIRYSDRRKAAETGEWQRYWYLTPKAIQQYIIDWDAGKEIKPFTFYLRQPTRVDLKKPVYNDSEPNNTRDKNTIVLHRKKATASGKRDAVIFDRIETKTTRLPPTVKGSRRRTYGIRGLTY